MKKLLFVLSVLLFSGISVLSQNPDEHHKKYWYYKHRLKEHFMLMGPEQGESLILSERRGYWCGDCIAFGDQTVLLGQYIAVLATEYTLLARNNQDTDETLEELYYALYAINRLDANAEWLYQPSSFSNVWMRPPISNTLNGFFVKDDADRLFVQNKFFDHINSSKIKTDDYNVRTHGGWNGDGYSQWYSGMKSTLCGGNAFSNEASIDQLYELLLGLRMVKEFIPMSTNYQGKSFQDGETNIHKEASNIALRLTSWLNHTRMNRTPTNTAAWSMTNGHSYERVDFQQNGRAWSWATAEITYDITEDYHGLIVRAKHSGQPAHHNITSFATGLTVWDGGAKNFFTTPDNARMALHHGAMLGRSNTNINFKNGYKKYDMFHVPLIRQVLYGGTNPITTADYMNILDDAPCDGPRAFKEDRTTWGRNPITNLVSVEFSTSDRISHPERRVNIPDLTAPFYVDHRGKVIYTVLKKPVFDGEFPGVDYMLYHNLYYLVNSSSYNNPINLRNMNIKVPYDLNKNISILNNLSMDKPIITNSNYSILFRAGNEIHFKPGFETNIKNNNGDIREFNAIIKRIDCSKEIETLNGYSPRNNTSLFTPDFVKHDLSHLNNFSYDESEDVEPIRNEIELSNNEILAFPNPSESIVNLTIVDANKLDNTYIVKVFNTKGELISEFEFQNSYSFDLTSYSKGLYFFNFYNKNTKSTVTKKIIKQ